METLAQADAARPMLVLGQEHRLRHMACAEVSGSMKAAGWDVAFAEAEATGPGPLETRAGVFAAARGGLRLEQPEGGFDVSPGGCAGRLLLCLIWLPKVGYMACFSVYMWCSEGFSIRNLAIYEALLRWTTEHKLPWLAGGDWNLEADAVQAAGWESHLDATLLAPEGITCRQGSGSRYDWFLVDRGLAGALGTAVVDETANISPHLPVQLECEVPLRQQRQRVVHRPRQFPLERPIGPMCKAPKYPSRQVETTEDLDRLWADTCATMEMELTQIFGWTEEEARPFCGRGGEVVFRWEPVVSANLHDAGAARSAEARAWKWMKAHLAWLVLLGEHIWGLGQSPWLSATRQGREFRRTWDILQSGQHLSAALQGHLAALRGGLAAVAAVMPWPPCARELLRGLVALATSVSRRLDAGARAARRRHLEARLDASHGNLLHRLTKIAQGWTQAKGSISKKALPREQQAAVDQEMQDWNEIWQPGTEEALWRLQGWRESEEALPQLTPSALRACCGAFKERTGLGVDHWHPRHWSWLSEAGLWALCRIFTAIEKLGTWPRQLRQLLIFLAAKDDGGGRPIHLLPSAARVWEAARRHVMDDWDKKLPRAWEWATAGRAAEQAVWEALLEDEAGEASCEHSAVLLLDLAKAYEHVHLNLLWLLGLKGGLAGQYLRVTLELYAAPRLLRLGQAVSSTASLSLKGLPAGSRMAIKWLKVLLVVGLDALTLRCEVELAEGLLGAVITAYVDDIALRCRGSLEVLREAFPRLVAFLLDTLGGPLRLAVSLSHGDTEGKTVFLTSSEEGRAALQRPLKELGVRWTREATWLGVDYAPMARCGKKAPAQAKQKQRRRQVEQRLRRVRRFAGRRGRASIVTRCGFLPSLAYGLSCSKLQAATVKALRRAASLTAPGQHRFRSTTLRLALDRDPTLSKLATKAIADWAKYWWLGRGSQREGRMQTAWSRQAARVGTSTVRAAVVRGPAGATILAARQLGWAMVSSTAFRLTDGTILDLRESCPQEVSHAALTAWQDAELRRWAAAPGRSELQPKPLVAPLSSLTGKRLTKEWTQHHRAVARMVVAGGFPSQEELHSQGRVASPLCPCCGAARGTLQHLYWQCSAPQVAQIRAPLLDIDRKDNFRDVAERGARGKQRWLWEHALVPDIAARWLWQPPSPETAVQWFGDEDAQGLLQNDMATDGSLIHGHYPSLAQGGWAAVQGVAGATEDAEPRAHGVFGALPFPRPTILLAELWALLQLLRHWSGRGTAAIDNSTVVRGLTRGRGWSTCASRAYAHIWELVWDKLDDVGCSLGFDLGAEADLVVLKVTSHKSKKAIAALAPEMGHFHRLNSVADRYAKLGAAHAQGDEGWKVKAAVAQAQLAKRAAQFIVEMRVGLHGAGLDLTGPLLERPRRPAGRLVLIQRPHVCAPRVDGLFVQCKVCHRARRRGSKRDFLGEECPGPPLCRPLAAAASASGPQGHLASAAARGHLLFGLERLLFCDRCGAWMHRRSRKMGLHLLEACPGAPRNPTAKCIRGRLREGRHPASGVRIGAVLALGVEEQEVAMACEVREDTEEHPTHQPQRAASGERQAKEQLRAAREDRLEERQRQEEQGLAPPAAPAAAADSRPGADFEADFGDDFWQRLRLHSVPRLGTE